MTRPGERGAETAARCGRRAMIAVTIVWGRVERAHACPGDRHGCLGDDRVRGRVVAAVVEVLDAAGSGPTTPSSRHRCGHSPCATMLEASTIRPPNPWSCTGRSSSTTGPLTRRRRSSVALVRWWCLSRSRGSARCVGEGCSRRTRLPLADLGSMRVMRRATLLMLGTTDRHSGWPLEMVLRAAGNGLKLRTVPVEYHERAGRPRCREPLATPLGRCWT